MKIIHLCLNGPYTEGWGYQENLLPKYQKKLGHEVTVIAQNRMHTDDGKITETACVEYVNEYGVKIRRMKLKNYHCRKIDRVFSPYDIYPILREERPDFIMIHGFIGSVSALQVIKYVRNINLNCTVVADIHQDNYNSAMPNRLKGYLLRTVFRVFNKKMYPYYSAIFFVAPSTRKFAVTYYKAPENKLRLLPLGCDTDLLDTMDRQTVRAWVRDQYKFDENDIILCHGGKLDKKKNTEELIEAVIRLHQEYGTIKLLIFGSIGNDVERLTSYMEEHREWIQFAGMLSITDYYKVFLASDLAVFPGGQSVLWQQAIACGLPILVKRHEGVEYLDLGGNIQILEGTTPLELYQTLKEVIESGRYLSMGEVAKKKGKNYFSYERIAREVLCADTQKGFYV